MPWLESVKTLLRKGVDIPKNCEKKECGNENDQRDNVIVNVTSILAQKSVRTHIDRETMGMERKERSLIAPKTENAFHRERFYTTPLERKSLLTLFQLKHITVTTS